MKPQTIRGTIYDLEHQTMRVRYREILYELLYWLTKPNGFIKRLYRGWLKYQPPLKLHLGSGRYYVEGWINIEIHPFYKKDLWLDIRNPWPFRAGEVALIYSSHVFEQFEWLDLRPILMECLRVLQPGGTMRTIVPSLEKAISCYLKDDFTGLNPDPASKSPGRKFNDTIVYHSQHKLLFDYGFLEEILQEVGFTEVRNLGFQESSMFDPKELSILEREDVAMNSLFVEAYKGG